MNFWSGKNILITGGAGFIGSHLVEFLISQNSKITVIDNLSNGREENIDTEKVRFLKKDVGDINVDGELLNNVDVVFHLAANADVPKANKDPLMDFKSNAESTLKVLEGIRKSNSDPIVFYPSTALIHGESGKERINEDWGINPISFYGLSKYIGEHYCELYAKTYGMKVVRGRYFNVYGPRLHCHVVFDTIRKISESDGKMEMLGNSQNTRDFLFVGDVVRATTILVEKKINYPVNVGSGEAISIENLVHTLLELCNKKRIVVNFSQESWKGNVNHYNADIKRLKEIGFEAKYSLNEGLLKTIKWFEEAYKKKVIA